MQNEFYFIIRNKNKNLNEMEEFKNNQLIFQIYKKKKKKKLKKKKKKKIKKKKKKKKIKKKKIL